jgi:hypothetical protein
MKPFGRKSVATNCRAAKFKAAKPTKPQQEPAASKGNLEWPVSFTLCTARF